MKVDLRKIRAYEKRTDEPLNLVKVINFFAFWGALVVGILYIIPDRAWELKLHGFFAIALIGVWRYSWFILNVINATIYEKVFYPKYVEKVKKIPINKRFPKRVFFIIPSYHEDYKVSAQTFKYLVEECYKIPSQVFLYISVGSKDEVRFISKIIEVHDIERRLKVNFLFQKQGKRVALAHALRAVSRQFTKPTSWHKGYKDDVIILMDGDTVVGKNLLFKILPFFVWNKKLGALTTDELVYYYGDTPLIGLWYKLKFAKRHIMMKSHSLHNRVLTLTGRFSAFRAYVILKEEFIEHVAKDNLTHWLFGRFRFLMGDDKSTWFYLLKNGWEMMYVPDALIFSVENRGGNFFKVTSSLMFRWYGNMLRNNFRALKLGPKRVGGFFIWYAILDQRISMWTSLVGPSASIMLSLFISPFYLIFYIAWAVFIRMLQIAVLIRERLSPEVVELLLLLYDQWVGSVIKIYASFNLAKQKWAKAKAQSIEISIDTYPTIRKYTPYFLLALYTFIFLLLIGIYTGVLKLPSIKFLLAKEANAYEVLDDYSKTINSLVQIKNKIYLPEKIYVENPIIIDKSNIQIIGKNTAIISNIKSPNKAVIIIKGKGVKYLGKTIKPYKEGSKKICINKIVKTYPEYIWIGSPNTDEFLKSLKTKWNKKYPFVRQQILKVSKIDKNCVILYDRLNFNADKNSVVKSFIPIKNVKIKSIKIIQKVGDKRPKLDYKFKNLYPEYMLDGILVSFGANVHLENIKIFNAGRHPINIENSYNVKMKNIYVNGALNKGKGGNGYVRFYKTHNSVLENCIIKNIRHLVLQWGASQNTIKNCNIFVDINFHGGFDRYNIVKNSKIILNKNHKWQPIQRTLPSSHWAPPDGKGNKVIDCEIILDN